LLYPAEEGGYVAMVPTFDLATESDTVEHALEMAQEAIGLHLWSMERDGDPIPPDVEPIVTRVEAEPIEGQPPTKDKLAAIDAAPRWDGRTR
jgi:predicted RNase H-like HicB family nuclease